MDDPYAILGLEPGARSEEVEAAYRRQVRRYPPELNPRRFALLKEAYERLTSFERLMDEAADNPGAVLEHVLPPVLGQLRPMAEPPTLAAADWEPFFAPLRTQAVREILAAWEPSPLEENGGPSSAAAAARTGSTALPSPAPGHTSPPPARRPHRR